jgi:hypothetical protein
MHAVLLSDSSKVVDGLSAMMDAAVGPHDSVYSYVSVEIALLIVEIAKLAEDRAEWFPRGKWATIQAIEERIQLQLYTCFKPPAARCGPNGECQICGAIPCKPGCEDGSEVL